jgi:hypothetical protein
MLLHLVSPWASFVLYRLLPVVSCPSDNGLGALTGVHLSSSPFLMVIAVCDGFRFGGGTWI